MCRHRRTAGRRGLIPVQTFGRQEADEGDATNKPPPSLARDLIKKLNEVLRVNSDQEKGVGTGLTRDKRWKEAPRGGNAANAAAVSKERAATVSAQPTTTEKYF